MCESAQLTWRSLSLPWMLSCRLRTGTYGKYLLTYGIIHGVCPETVARSTYNRVRENVLGGYIEMHQRVFQ